MIDRKRAIWPWIVCPLLIVALYVASIGPAFTLAMRRGEFLRSYQIVYWPIIQPCLRSGTADEILCRYLSFCCGFRVRRQVDPR